ncbi:hypothetical protein B0J11DRAFT_485955 [Dendryphion nanum]|uniref:DUF2828 domain-containing protein n=1 Tax=Dendryphion nanum TaxID=256645 RepID=A0A9P9DWG7_9PLEO|nr:hypothetical protein B0J11DRAFT_485955 [Dendryphion nanum]
MADANTNQEVKHSVLDSTFPVHIPIHHALMLPENEFQRHIRAELARTTKPVSEASNESVTAVDEPEHESFVSRHNAKRRATSPAETGRPQKAAFIQGLHEHEAHVKTEDDLLAENKALTQNADITNVSAKNPLVNLFYDLGETISGEKIKVLLEEAWNEDPLVTLKLIWNSRCIHLGKSNKFAAYKALGWLAEEHPLTLLVNLPWLVKPVIEKKKPITENDKPSDPAASIKDDSDDFEMMDTDDKPAKKPHVVPHGMSHGYWKDLLNLLVFAARDQLKHDGEFEPILNVREAKAANRKRYREWDCDRAKANKKQAILLHHQNVLSKLESDPFYRALHQTVARMFAKQFQDDAVYLNSGRKSDLKFLSLAAKWSPTFKEFHDRNTFVLSSISEILYPQPAEVCPDATNRQLYLRFAREACRKEYVSPLRKALKIVEREIAANRFEDIKYDSLPSLAMDRYAALFMKKDTERFNQYINKVSEGSARISGATLLPSTLVSKVRAITPNFHSSTKSFEQVKTNAQAAMTRKLLDGQWKTLVKRVRDSGALSSSIAVCDVSGSMTSPMFKDKSVPMDSAIGLSLLLAEVTEGGFGGSVITFSDNPSVINVAEGNDLDLLDKVSKLMRSDWGYSTNFVSVFEDLILPMAIQKKLSQDEMVKQIFVFSDMQFNEATGTDRWTSSFERIKAKYVEAGYEMPALIFWNLAADATDKPVTMDDSNTALVSGYSQGLLKVFLDSGGFECEDEDEDEIVEEEVDEGSGEVVVAKEKKKMDPLALVKKAVSHKSFDMLEVVD